MPESAAEVYRRIVDAVGADGHLPMPASAEWDIFPWEVIDGALVPKVVPPPGEEPARFGESPDKPCMDCAGFESARIVWEDDNWVLTHRGRPSGLPLVLMLHAREHDDAGQLTDDRASEFGRIANRLVRIIENLPHIGRVHVQRIGDGGSHFHVWFLARTEGLVTILGSTAAEWDDVLPAGPEEIWRQDLHRVAVKLANWGGHARA